MHISQKVKDAVYDVMVWVLFLVILPVVAI